METKVNIRYRETTLNLTQVNDIIELKIRYSPDEDNKINPIFKEAKHYKCFDELLAFFRNIQSTPDCLKSTNFMFGTQRSYQGHEFYQPKTSIEDLILFIEERKNNSTLKLQIEEEFLALTINEDDPINCLSNTCSLQ
jgi:hypothetical protein